MMESLEERYEVARLISLELTGAATEEELARLAAWRGECAEHEGEYGAIRVRLAAELEQGERVDRERGWQRVRGRWGVWGSEVRETEAGRSGEGVWGGVERTEEGEVRGAGEDGKRGRVVRMGGWRKRLAWGAACAGLAAGVIWGLRGGDGVEVPEREGMAVLVLGSGERVVLDGGKDGVVRECGDARVTVEGRTVRYEGRDSGVTEVNVLEIPRGAEYELVLADGTRVWVNSESQLRYPTRFTGDVRRVEMEGEVCFDVAQREGMPFVVGAKGTEVRVLGTLFNVESYGSEGEVRTTLVRGRVEVVAKGGRVELEPDRQAVVDGEGRVTVREVYGEEYVGWTKGEFRFRRQELEGIMERLARWYNVEVFYANPELKGVRFTLNTKRYEESGDVLSKIEKTGEVRFRVKGRTVVVERGD